MKAFKSVDPVKPVSLQWGVGITQCVESQRGAASTAKAEERGILSFGSSCLSRAIWAGVYSTQTSRLTLSDTAGFPEPPACRRRIVGCHSFLSGGNQFCTAPRYCVCVSSIYVSLYHLPVASLPIQPSTHPSFSPRVFREPLQHSLTNTLWFLFVIHGSYQFICFYLFLYSVSI